MDKVEISPEEVLKHKKIAHDYLATTVQILTTRVQFYYEEFEGAHQAIQYQRALLAQTKADIEAMEPSKPEEPKKPYLMDLTHVKGEEKPNV